MDKIACLKDIEKIAHEKLPINALDYYRSGAGHMKTVADNDRSYNKYVILPRMLIDVSRRDLSTTVLGRKVSMPIGIAPTAMQRMAHPDGECASVKAAQDAGVIFILSTLSTSSVEEVGQAGPKAIKWFQLYIYKDRKVTRQLIKRAENAGFSALVLTVDAPFFGRRLADLRNKFELPSHLRMANFQGLGDLETKAGSSEGGSGINNYVASLFDPSLTWSDIDWLKSITRLPIILKGILHPDDAIRGIKAGASGIIVSNHGARQIDGVPATIDALGPIKEAVGDDIELYLDGGINEGTDVLKALALGAKCVFLGRPTLWGLALNGKAGVDKTLQLMRDEFDTAMALSGCKDIRSINKNLILTPKSNY